MTVSREKYTELLEQFKAISEPFITQDDIQRLKEEYKKIINSTRVLEKIKDIKSLLCVLEKRGIVQYNDISVLKSIANYIVQDKSVEKLISDYEQWLEENSSYVNYFYSRGKSQTLLNQNNISKHKMSETENSCNILNDVINNASEEHKIKSEQCTEPLLPKEPFINIVSSNFKENNFTTIINDRKPSKRIKKRRYIIPLILLILLILLICIILFIVKMYYQSSAIVPKGDRGLQMPMESNRSSMTHYMANINIGIAEQSSFGINQTQNTANTYVPVTPVDPEKTIQDTIIKKISKRIGKYFWKDVCRYLKIPEGEIINIEDSTRTPRTIENMFTEALQMFFSEQRPNWRMELLNALSEARRNDLKDTVLEIFSQKPFR